MRKPASIDEARPILEMYNSLRDEVKIHEFELCNLRMIVINLFKKSGFENLELRLNPVLERKLMLWLKSVMGPTKLEHLISLQDLLIRILWAILEGELDNRKYRIFVVFFFFFCNGENHIALNCPNKTERGEANNNNNSQEN